MKTLKMKNLRQNDVIKTRDGAFYVWDGTVGRKCDPKDKFLNDFITWNQNGTPVKEFKDGRKDVVRVWRVKCDHYQQQKTEAYKIASGNSTEYGLVDIYTEPVKVKPVAREIPVMPVKKSTKPNRPPVPNYIANKSNNKDSEDFIDLIASLLR